VQKDKQYGVVKIVVIYVIAGFAWILFSDTAVRWFFTDPENINHIAIFNGLFFILWSSVLLFILISRFNNRMNQSFIALKTNEKCLQTLIQTIPDLVWLKDVNGVFLSCNRQFEQILQVKETDIIGKTDYDFVDAELADCFREHDRAVVRAGKPTRNEEWVTFANDGRRIFLETIKTPMYDDSGMLIGILGIGRDMTERKRIEDELRESEDKFRLTFNASPDAINVNRLDDGCFLDINESFTRLMGFTREDVLGRTSLDVHIWADPADREVLVQGLKRNGYYENLEAKFRTKDGTLVTGLMSARIVSMKNVPHIISVTRDISERKQYERELLKMEKLESLGILAGGIAHDFNNVLTGIIGNITLAKAYLGSGHQSIIPLTSAEKAAVRAGDLAHQLLTFARGGEPVKKVVSPRHIVEEALSFILHGSNVKGVTDIPDSLHAFEADEGQISQVFHNIAINAMQAMVGGGTLVVAARDVILVEDNTLSLPAGSYVCFTFHDHGCGISMGNIGKIFDPYFTTKPSGSGLGLASAYSIIIKHGGHIGVSSEPEKGTTFTIHLPSLGEPYTEPGEIISSRKPDRGYNGSVLVMDDEATIRETAESLLNHLGYQVTTCSDGNEAIELYRRAWKNGHPYSAVIMDLTVPGGLGGKEAAARILAEFPEARLLVSSGYSNDSILSQYREHGFIGAIPKPYSLNDFMTALAGL